jgi:hypothetical protein
VAGADGGVAGADGGAAGADGGAAGADGGAAGADGGAAGADGGAAGADGGAGDGGHSDAGSGDGGMTCSPACGAGSICVGTGTEGGAIKVADDAGVCPSGTHPTGVGNICTNDLAYSCKSIPAGCNGTVTCACAASLCQASHVCRGPSDGVLTCVQQVP